MPMDPTEQELWRRYRTEDDSAARDYLVLRYMPWARSVALAVARRLRSGPMEWSDHVQNANIGLLEAMSRYDVARGVDFMAYAKPRVRGSVFNGMRSWTRENLVNDGRFKQERLDSLQGGVSDDLLTGFVDTVVGLGLGLLLENSATPAPDSASLDEYGHVLRDVMIDLPDRQRQILISHYFMHMQFQDIAADLGLTKGRISQLHKEALARLREALRTRRYERDCFF